MNIQTAERIRELREKNHLTQSELAKKLYITRSSINAWEMAVSIPSTEKIADLCSILHTTANYLLGIDNEELLPLDRYTAEEKELLYQLTNYFDKK